MWHDFVDEARGARLLCRDRLARQDHLQRALAADQPRQSLRAAERRRKAQIDFRLGEGRALAGNSKRRGFGDFAATAIGQPVDRDDDRLRERFDAPRQTLSAPHEAAHHLCGTAMQRDASPAISAPAENAWSPAPVRITARNPSSASISSSETCKPVDRRRVERVELVRPVERQKHNRPPSFHQDRIRTRVDAR